MEFLKMIFLFCLATTTTSQMAKPGCPEKCGNVTIPYPFGTTKGCYLDTNHSDFLIHCNQTTVPPTLFLTRWYSDTVLEVLNISVDGQLRILTNVATKCYDRYGNVTVDASGALAEKSLYVPHPDVFLLFPYSVTRNKFVAIGCDTRATLLGHNVSVGCSSRCDDKSESTTVTDDDDEPCSGRGCCQTPIFKEMETPFIILDTSFKSYYNHSGDGVRSFNPCDSAFIIEETSFNFPKVYLQHLITRVPSILDWVVANQTCKEATKNSSTYACTSNTYCYESDSGPGYRCNCSSGYKGNPYLPNGCQDIDECAGPQLNNCVKKCINTIGNFTCSCPTGESGDGTKDGKGCEVDKSMVIKLIAGFVVGLIVLVICGSLLCVRFKKRRLVQLKHKLFMQNGGLMLQQQLSKINGYNETAKIFTAEELEKATEKYHNSRIVGQGGFGTVYRGVLVDHRVVAIKKSKLVDQSQIEQFVNEIVVLSQINHRNVVRLLGCCLETEVPLLVYEFVSNGTLFEHIHEQTKASAMPWNTRLKIAAETSGVLSYLHSAASVPIVHRDIKSTNILLDDNYIAKVSDFGASRLIPIDRTELTTLVKGTLGYLDPEYFLTSQLTEKSDVYSFGVVLVELITGKKALCFERPEQERSLANYFLKSLKEERLFEVVGDYNVPKENNRDEINEVADLAERCIRIKGDERPSMKEVAMELERLMRNHTWVGAETVIEEGTHYMPRDGQGTLEKFNSDGEAALLA